MIAAQGIPVLQPIDVRPIRVPAYHNEHVADFRQWYVSNEPALSEYFQQLVDAEPEGCDFFEFVAIAHEREVMRAAGLLEETPEC